MQVGNSRKLLGGKAAIEGVKSPNAFVLPLDVGFHESHIGCQVFKQWARIPPAQYRDSNLRILACQRVDHGNGHGHVAQC